MKKSSTEYWNRPEITRRSFLVFVFLSIIYAMAVYLVYLTYTNDLLIPLFMAVIGIWLFKDGYDGIRRETSRPLCRLTDEFIVSDLDRKVTPWNVVTRIDVDSGRKEVEIQHVPIKDSPKKSPKSVKIYGKWMQDWNIFLEDLKAECEMRSIEFTAR